MRRQWGKTRAPGRSAGNRQCECRKEGGKRTECLSTLSAAPPRDEDSIVRIRCSAAAFNGSKAMDWELQQLRKSSTDRMLVGICGGLGEYTPVPALAWRIAFVIL